MKKNYQKPSMKVVKLQHQNHILADSIHTVSGNVFNGGITGGSGTGRSRDCDWDWDDEE